MRQFSDRLTRKGIFLLWTINCERCDMVLVNLSRDPYFLAVLEGKDADILPLRMNDREASLGICADSF